MRDVGSGGNQGFLSLHFHHLPERANAEGNVQSHPRVQLDLQIFANEALEAGELGGEIGPAGGKAGQEEGAGGVRLCTSFDADVGKEDPDVDARQCAASGIADISGDFSNGILRRHRDGNRQCEKERPPCARARFNIVASVLFDL